MSLDPRILSLLGGQDWWDVADFPTRLMDQNFGVGLLDDDLHPPCPHRGYMIRPRTQENLDSSGQSEVTVDENKFQVMLDVSTFEPDDIELKIVDNLIVIHAKHEEREDEYGFISREFTRKYLLPKDVLPETVKSSLNEEGILKITAPRKVEKKEQVVRKVPIIMARVETSD